MLEKLQIVKQRFDEVNDLIIQPDIIADQKRYIQLSKEYKDLKAIVDKGNQYKRLLDNIAEAEEIINDGSDTEMMEMAKMQLEEAKEKIDFLQDTTPAVIPFLSNMIKEGFMENLYCVVYL